MKDEVRKETEIRTKDTKITYSNGDESGENKDSFTINILFFALARELVGQESIELSVSKNSTTKTVLNIVLGRYPRLTQLAESSIFAVNQEFIDQGTELQLSAGDEVAFIPPISGG